LIFYQQRHPWPWHRKWGLRALTLPQSPTLPLKITGNVLIRFLLIREIRRNHSTMGSFKNYENNNSKKYPLSKGC